MAFAIADIRTRIASELSKLDDFSSVQDDLIKDALTDLLTALVEFVRYSSALAVTTATSTYTKPATIDVIERIENAAGDAVSYSVDKYEGKITFQDTPGSAQSYTVYGTPNNLRTNAAAVIAALPESYYRSLWAYVKAACHDNAESDSAETMYQKAERSAHELLMYLNSEPGYRDRQISIVDAEGNRIGVANPVDGVDNDITDMGSVESYE